MGGKHLDNSNRMNLARNMRQSTRHAPYDDNTLYQRDLEREGEGRGGRPIVDPSLEREVDRMGRVHIRKPQYRFSFEEGYEGLGPKGYKRSDERIKEDVCDALYKSYDIDASEVEVDVQGGIVNLRGAVDSRETKRMTEDVVDTIAGVVDVHNELKIVGQS